MTPREGPVAWAVIDKDGEFWDAAPLSSKEYADKRAAVLNRTRDGYPTPYTVVPLYAHPAATAREEAFYEAALAYFESDKARMAAFTGEVFIEGPESAAIAEAGKRLGAARAAYAALALARSTGGSNG